MSHPIESLAKAIENKQTATLATVVEVSGASPAKVGAQIVLLNERTIVGTVGGGKLEAAILEDARQTLRPAVRVCIIIRSQKQDLMPLGRYVVEMSAFLSSLFYPPPN